ncbi:hypothetical protein AVEN_157551-1 [Araneus ventricosus]|uniref:RNase H type-1 domain-containing protein n=1 Tax=Araneus ventricosus TaxID=182803 RepID=A0A4Y2KEI1_ARAVE|nr:hypothetical protein AVEN_157551-1 [Araneus ventricosus]
MMDMDGFRINNETVFAVCIVKSNDLYKDFLCKLNPTNSVFQAELASIGFAAGWALEHNQLVGEADHYARSPKNSTSRNLQSKIRRYGLKI